MQGLSFPMPILKTRRTRTVKKKKKDGYSSLKSVSGNDASDRRRERMQIERGGMEERARKGKIIEGRIRRAMNIFIECRKVGGWIREQHMSWRRNTGVWKWSRSSSVTLPGHRTDSQKSDVNRKRQQQHDSLIGPVDKHCYDPQAAQSKLEKALFLCSSWSQR